MNLLLIRHGDPDYPNDTITEKGQKQSQLLAECLRDTQVDKLFVSPMGRAIHTADYLKEEKGIKSTVLPFLEEIKGCYNGTDFCWDQHACDLLAGGQEVTMKNWPQLVPYGEYLPPVVDSFLNDWEAFMAEHGLKREGSRYKLENPEEDNIVLVCHAGVIFSILSHLLNIPLPIVYSQLLVLPTSITTLKLIDKDGYGVFRLIGLNDMNHTLPLGIDDDFRPPRS